MLLSKNTILLLCGLVGLAALLAQSGLTPSTLLTLLPGGAGRRRQFGSTGFGTSCGQTLTSRQIELKLEAPFNLLRADGKQPFAYDALNKFEKPRLREHLGVSPTYNSNNNHGGGGRGGGDYGLMTESQRAVTLHFAGGGSMDLKHLAARRIAEALFGGSSSSSNDRSSSSSPSSTSPFSSSSSILDVNCSNFVDLGRLRADIARTLHRCPRSVVILHDVEKLQQQPGGSRRSSGGSEGSSSSSSDSRNRFGSAAGLISIERFFEDETVEVADGVLSGGGGGGSGGGGGGGGGVSIDMRQAVFILTSEVGKEELIAKGVTHSDFSSRTSEEVIEVIKQATRKWVSARPALGGRLSNSQVPFV